jgi:hypothetical protein
MTEKLIDWVDFSLLIVAFLSLTGLPSIWLLSLLQPTTIWGQIMVCVGPWLISWPAVYAVCKRRNCLWVLRGQ